jgi:hypothetical protein
MMADSNMARDSFATFIPLSVDSDARTKIIFDFFDLLSAIAAHGKTNGLGGRKLSRLAGWWAFEHNDDGKGFEGGYKGWARFVSSITFQIGLLTSLQCCGCMQSSILCLPTILIPTIPERTEWNFYTADIAPKAGSRDRVSSRETITPTIEYD